MRQRAGQLGEDRQVGMEPDPLDPAHAERKQGPLILEELDRAVRDARLGPIGGGTDETILGRQFGL